MCNFKIEVGVRIVDNKRDITIVDRKYIQDKKGQNHKYYKYKCNKCSFDGGKHWSIKDRCYKDEFWIEENHLLKGVGCACCPNQIVVKGLNDLATTNPQLINYLVNIEDAYIHTSKSGDKIFCRCIDCKFEKKITINTLNSQGFSCTNCGDGISFPEKVMRNLLNNIVEKNLINNLIYQYSKNNSLWCKKYKYDFYFELNNEEYIIETHGLQHYREIGGNWDKLEKTQLNDRLKKELALNNGIKEENYIVIDCRKSELDWIKEHILESNLNKIFDLSNIDWDSINEKSQNNIVKEVCDYWNNKQENETTTNLKKIFLLSGSTICNYLNKGEKLGWCDYNGKEESNKINKINNDRKCNVRQVEIFKNNISLGIFPSIKELGDQSKEKFGIQLYNTTISAVCKGKRLHHKGFTFKYVS